MIYDYIDDEDDTPTSRILSWISKIKNHEKLKSGRNDKKTNT